MESRISCNLKTRLEECSKLTENKLYSVMDRNADGFEVLKDSMLYSLSAGGKRIRPFLVLEFCRLFGGNAEDALSFAAAVEMIHTSSLIHDDLPCMDNDDLRRGKPTNHKVYGEANALLAADALMLYSFSVAADSKNVKNENIIRAVKEMSECSGFCGMVGGQVIDLIGEKEKYGIDKLKYMQSLKTGKLITLSCLLGCYAADVNDEKKLSAARTYAEKIGLCFQIVDDVLDVTGTVEELGKPIGSDAENDKNTFINFYTPAQALEYARKLTEEAKDAVKEYYGSETLCELADWLLVRKH